MSSTHLALPRRSQRVGTIIPGPVISLDVWYQTVIFQVYVIYGEHWLYDIIQWYQRFILWYQGLDSDICGLLVSNNDTLFCLISMISIVKKKDWYHYGSLWYWTIQNQSITQVTQIPDHIKVWFAVIPFWY